MILVYEFSFSNEMKRIRHILSLLLIITIGMPAVAQSDIEITDSISADWGDGMGGGLFPNLPSDPVTSITLSQTSITLEGGERVRLTALTNSTAANKKVTWSVENNEIARVSSNGSVIGMKMGATIVKATSVSNPEISASCNVTVTSDYSNKLPDVPFEFFYEAAQYNTATQSIPNHELANLREHSLQLSASLPTDNGDYLTLNERCEGYINKWGKESTESGAYFFREGQDNMTIVCKVKPRLDTGNASDFISNRGGGYNYMFRIGDYNSAFLHTGTAYQDDRVLKLSYSDEPQVLAVRVNGSEDYILIDNLTTGESKRVNGVNWGGSNTAMKFFYNDGGEYWTGDFYWMYYSFEFLTDEEFSSFLFQQERPLVTGDANGDGAVNVTDAVYLINVCLNMTDDFDVTRCDVNGDGTINVTDAVTIINICLKIN